MSLSLVLPAITGDLDRLRYLLRAGADVHANDDEELRCAAMTGCADVVQVLLQAGANVHAKDDEALRKASYYGYPEVVHFLLEAGADVHAKEGESLRVAVIRGHKKVVQKLLLAGADPAGLDFRELRNFLTPQLLLFLPEGLLAKMRITGWREKKSLLLRIKEDDALSAKISLADLYYRPGGPGYYQAILF